MKAIPTAILVGVLVVLGKWARNQKPNIDNAVGIGGMAAILAIMEEIDENLEKGFSLLIILTMIFYYWEDLIRAAGFQPGGGFAARRRGRQIDQNRQQPFSGQA